MLLRLIAESLSVCPQAFVAAHHTEVLPAKEHGRLTSPMLACVCVSVSSLACTLHTVLL